MTKHILIFLLLLCITSLELYASDLPPTSRITLDTPARSDLVGYTGETLTFSSSTSSANCGSITAREWRLNGSVVSTNATYSSTFTLPAGVYEQTYTLSLKTTNSCMGLHHTVTKTLTIRRDQRIYFITDNIGSVRSTLNETGDVISYDDYYPFGLSMPGRSGNIANPNDNYRYIGEEYDDESGLSIYNLNARTYDPVTGRFMQIDPLFDHPNQVGLSPFNYSWNNPVTLSDPSGECPQCPIGFAIGASVEFITQVGIGMASGQSFGESVRNVDYLDVAIAGGAGALTGGGSAFLNTGGKIVLGAGANVAEGFLTETFDGDRNTIISMNSSADYSIVDLGVDALVGGGAEAFSIIGKQVAQGTDEAASLRSTADRAERIASNGAPRAGQTNYAIATRQAANNYGEGTTAQTIAATGQSLVSGAVNGGGNSQAPQQTNRFVFRPYVAQQDQTRVKIPGN